MPRDTSLNIAIEGPQRPLPKRSGNATDLVSDAIAVPDLDGPRHETVGPSVEFSCAPSINDAMLHTML